MRESTPEMEQWRRHNERVLILSRPARDLSEPAEQDILNGINSLWSDTKKASRLCVQGNCLLGCPPEGDEESAKAACWNLIVAAVGPSIVQCLLYRWKGFDAASAKYSRGRSIMDLWKCAIESLSPRKVSGAARAEAVQAAIQGREVQHATKKNIRGGLIVQALEQDPTARLQKLLLC